jgi:hypothetical protein
MRDCEDKGTCVPATPVTDKAGLCIRATLIVHVGVRAPHRLPQPGEPRVKKPHPPCSAVEAVTLENSDAPDLLAFGLTMIEDHEADAMPTSYELLGEEDLLPLCTPDIGQVFAS